MRSNERALIAVFQNPYHLWGFPAVLLNFVFKGAQSKSQYLIFIFCICKYNHLKVQSEIKSQSEIKIYRFEKLAIDLDPRV